MEALVLVVDVGESAGAAPPDGRPSFLTTSLQCCDRIVQRKLFADKCRDHVALVLVGTDETDNPLADDDDGDGDGEQYRHVRLARRLATVDWDLVRLVTERVHVGAGRGDWLDGLVVALDHLKSSDKVHAYAQRRLVLFSDFAGVLCDDQLSVIVTGLCQLEVDLTVIGTELSEPTATDGTNGAGDPLAGPSRRPDSCRHDGKPKTWQQLAGEDVARRLVDGVDGQFFTFEQALPQLLFFRKRTCRAAPWNAPLEIGELTVPITGYSQVRKATAPTWMKMVANEAVTVRRRTMYERADGTRTPVEAAHTVRAYRYGTTLVPFSRDNEEALCYRSGAPRSVQVLGFTAAANVPAHLYQDTQSVQIVARRGDAAAQAALSALVHALHETDMCAIARRTYSASSQPRLGALLPLIKQSCADQQVVRLECLVFVQLPFCEDMRSPMFEPLPAAVDKAQLAAVDRLMDAMDLTTPAARPTAELLTPGGLVSPQFQRLYQVLAARALRPSAPLPPPDADLLRQLSVAPALSAAAAPALRELAAVFPLTEATRPHQQRHTGRDLFGSADAGATPSTDAPSVADPTACAVTQVGTVTPADDFVALASRDDVNFGELCVQMQGVVLRLAAESLARPGLLDKTVDALACLRRGCVDVAPRRYNDWVRGVRCCLLERPSVWERVVARRLGPIEATESRLPTGLHGADDQFYSGSGAVKSESAPPADQQQDDELLDDL